MTTILTAVGVVILSVVAAAVIWHIKPEWEVGFSLRWIWNMESVYLVQQVFSWILLPPTSWAAITFDTCFLLLRWLPHFYHLIVWRSSHISLSVISVVVPRVSPLVLFSILRFHQQNYVCLLIHTCLFSLQNLMNWYVMINPIQCLAVSLLHPGMWL